MYTNNRKASLIAAALAAAFIFVASLIFNGGNIFIAAVSALLGIPFFFLANFAFARYRASLAKRVVPSTQRTIDSASVVWDVRMNGVLVAQVEDEVIAAVQGNIAGDWRYMAAQAINVLGVPLRILDKLLAAVPAIAFWLILACAFLDPASLIQTLTAIRQASPHEIQQGVSTVVMMLTLTGMILFGVSCATNGYTFGLRNIYREEFRNRIRTSMNIAATGDMTIERTANGEYSEYEPDIFGWVRATQRAKKR